MFWPAVCVLMRSVFTPHFLVLLASLYAWWASALPCARNWQIVAGVGDTEGPKTNGQSCWDFVDKDKNAQVKEHSSLEGRSLALDKGLKLGSLPTLMS